MKSLNYFWILALCFALMSASSPKGKDKDDGDLSQDDFLKIKNSIFEVVRPLTLEAPNIKYKNPVPYDKLPHYLIKDKQVSFGTAFAIGEKTIVSAAHVFDVHKQPVYLKDVRLKDQDGNLHEIDEVKKFSELEDYIVFTLKTYPKNMTFLNIATKSDIGANVHAIGNALGQGIVERNGRITSFTDEEMLGKWKYVRFTAPASPGNSGGPLVNNNAEVLGIVVRRSNDENLNYAVPMDLLKKDDGKVANFYDRTVAESESGERLFTPWSKKLPLPQKLMDFSNAASKAYIQGILDRRAEFEKQFKDQIFPGDKNIQPYLRAQKTTLSYSVADKNTSGVWENFVMNKISETTLPSGQTLYFGFENDSLARLDAEAYLEKPKNKKLLDFISDPKTYFNQIIEVFSFYITIAEEKLVIKDLGAPYKVTPWTDQYGRKWTSAFWSLAPFDLVINAQCLPAPMGIACKLRAYETWRESHVDFYEKLDAKRTILSYAGKLSEWKEFLALPEKWKPASMNGVTIDAKNGIIEDKKSGLRLKSPEKFNDKSSIDIYSKHRLDLKDEEIVQISVLPDKENKPMYYDVERIYDALKSNSDDLKDKRKKMFDKKQPFDCKLTETNEGYFEACVEKDNVTTYPDVKSIVIYDCSSNKDKPEKQFEEKCDQFKKLNLQ